MKSHHASNHIYFYQTHSPFEKKNNKKTKRQRIWAYVTKQLNIAKQQTPSVSKNRINTSTDS